MNRVPVIAKDGTALMPTKCSKARKLVRDSNAIGKWSKLGQYYIQLTLEPLGTETQPIVGGCDPGKKYSGIGVQSSKVTLFTAHLILPFETVNTVIGYGRETRPSLAVKKLKSSYYNVILDGSVN